LSNKYYVGKDVTSFSDKGKYKPISRVTLLVDDENSLTAGDDTGMEVIASCPHATQPMVNALLQTMKGYQYQAYEADAANIDPAAELGDGVTVGGIYSPLSKLSDDGRGYAGISSPGEAEMEDEYPSEGYITQEFNRKIAETRSTITKTSEEINLKVEGIDGRVSDITQTVDGISLSVTSASNPDGQTTATITLKVGPNNYTGYIKLDGNVDVSGQLSADALYSAFGEIADLSVNRLSTSRRVVKYLAGDTTDDNFIRVAEQSLEFVAGIAKGTTEQAKNPNGELIYWEADPAGASIGSDGYPYANGERIFTTTKQTSWPVMVYQYEEQVKRAISFTSDGKYYYPVDIFGAGDTNGKQRGYLVKRQNSLELTYETSLGKLLGLAARDDGYMDLMGLRKSAALDFSEWDKGYFAELVDGEKTPYRYTVTFDQQRRPIRITDNSGHATLIRW
jgi:hypothetical protein